MPNLGQVAVKISDDLSKEQKNTLFVTKNIVPLTPHMLPGLAVGTCPAYEWLKSKAVTDEIKDAWLNQHEEDSEVSYVVTKFVDGVPLKDVYLEEKRATLEIAIQVAQALCVCEYKLFVHHDLHFDNIFVEYFKDNELIQYEYPFSFSLSTKIKVNILEHQD